MRGDVKRNRSAVDPRNLEHLPITDTVGKLDLHKFLKEKYYETTKLITP